MIFYTEIVERIYQQTVTAENVVSGSLTYRDMRQILTDIHQVPSIEVRRHCILLCLPPVTAILLHNRVYILVNDDLKIDSLIRSLVQLSEEHFKGKPATKPRSTFEFAALEVLITAAFFQLNQDIFHLERQFETTKCVVSKGTLTLPHLEGLHEIRGIIQSYGSRVKAFDKAFDKLISNPEDMRRMELTKYLHDPFPFEAAASPQAASPNPDLEILLGYFDQEMDQFTSRVTQLQESIDNTDRLLTLRLALVRNRLMFFDLGATIASCGTAIGTCISGIFGMNLLSGLEESYPAFVVTSLIILVVFLLSLILIVHVWRKFRI